VLHSPQSVLFGIPVPFYGLFWFVSMGSCSTCRPCGARRSGGCRGPAWCGRWSECVSSST
jgi:hypothetical protein